jgi:hypothetical protein
MLLHVWRTYSYSLDSTRDIMFMNRHFCFSARIFCSGQPRPSLFPFRIHHRSVNVLRSVNNETFRLTSLSLE